MGRRAGVAAAVAALGVVVVVAGCSGDPGNAADTTAVRTTTTTIRRPLAPGSTTFPTVNVPAMPTSTTLPPILVPADVKPPNAVYTVVAGDTWIRIAQKVRVPLQDILDANQMTVNTALYPGMILQIPPPPTTTTGPTTTVPIAVVGRYTVVAGDAWGSIAQKLGVNLSDLLRVNKASTETLILPGQQINVPAKRAR